MSDTAYTYAVARVRAKEASLLSDQDIEQLITCKTYGDAVDILHGHGWGNGDKTESLREIVTQETEKTWRDVSEMAPDPSVFDILSITKEYHNLKAAIKQVCTQDPAEHVYYGGLRFSPGELKDMIGKRDFSRLPDGMARPAAEATEALLQTEDGQLCDIIIDRAVLDELLKAGRASSSAFIRDYVEETVAVADIRIAVRCAGTGKGRDFMERAMAECGKVSKDALIRAALSGVDEVCEYLRSAGFAEAADSVEQSPSAFERWCDNTIIDAIKPQKYNSFSEGPLIAYALARENEIKTVRIILTCKMNNLSDEFIRERVRRMYV